jgi:hypothetical protein
LTSRFFLYDSAKMLFWTFLVFNGIMLGIFTFQKHTDNIVPFLTVSGLILLGFLVLIPAIAILVFGNRIPMSFDIRPDGVFYVSHSRRAKTLNRVAIIAGLLSRRPGVAGAGLLSAARESGGIDWEDIHTIREYPCPSPESRLDRKH